MAQGTGRHGHKDSKEPYPHTKSGGGQKMQASSRGGGGGNGSDGGSRQESRGSGGENLQGREYRDAQGNIHHHTNTYMQQHGKDRGR